jgi:hypothetical protein
MYSGKAGAAPQPSPSVTAGEDLGLAQNAQRLSDIVASRETGWDKNYYFVAWGEEIGPFGFMQDLQIVAGAKVKVAQGQAQQQRLNWTFLPSLFQASVKWAPTG